MFFKIVVALPDVLVYYGINDSKEVLDNCVFARYFGSKPRNRSRSSSAFGLECRDLLANTSELGREFQQSTRPTGAIASSFGGPLQVSSRLGRLS